MPESTPHLDPADIQPRIDFVCRWRLEDRSDWFSYRVPSHQFLLVEDGELRARVDGDLIEAGPGDLLCLRPQPRNEYGRRGRVAYFEMHLAFAPPPRRAIALWLHGRPIPPLVRLGEHRGAATAAFTALCLDVGAAGDAAALRSQASVHALLAAIAAALAGSAPVVRHEDPWLRARAVLENDLHRPLRLAEAAAEAGVGEDHFIRGFRRRFGVSPMAHRGRARLRAAAAALADATVAVKEAAARFGFTDTSAFARAFRRGFGVPPSAWRAAATQLPPPSAEAAVPYPLNRHIRPPGGDEGWFTWG
ncbi:MAG TPA: AraC family transcriptional regulator [Planctomycetota bacterium]|nr:AraC family transcriptional regulator [Planctomycetota bacterium]